MFVAQSYCQQTYQLVIKFLKNLTKMTFSNSIQVKMIKISTVPGTQEVMINDLFQVNWLVQT